MRMSAVKRCKAAEGDRVLKICLKVCSFKQHGRMVREGLTDQWHLKLWPKEARMQVMCKVLEVREDSGVYIQQAGPNGWCGVREKVTRDGLRETARSEPHRVPWPSTTLACSLSETGALEGLWVEKRHAQTIFYRDHTL